MHFEGQIPQDYHTFALFDTPKMGNWMTPLKTWPKTWAIPKGNESSSNQPFFRMHFYVSFREGIAHQNKKYTPERSNTKKKRTNAPPTWRKAYPQIRPRSVAWTYRRDPIRDLIDNPWWSSQGYPEILENPPENKQILVNDEYIYI